MTPVPGRPDGAARLAPPVLELAGATLVRGRTRVLDRLTLTVRAGEHTAILGPNGAGKSSLLRMLTLEEYPLRGPDIPEPLRWFGRARWDVATLRTRLGVVSGDLDTSFARTTRRGRVGGLEAVVSGFLASQGLFSHQRVSPEMWQAAGSALARVGVSHLAETPLTEMSAGERRRILIARALVTAPEVLLLDEPTTGLDLVSRHAFLQVLRRLCAEGVTLLLATHHVDEILPEVTRVVLLHGGRILHDGTPETVLTSERLSAVYGAPVAVDRAGDVWRVRVN